jgi:HEAT repeat protein
MLDLLRTNPPRELRFELVYDLGQLRDARAFDVFSAIIRDRSEDVGVRGLAAELISNFDGVDAVPVLIEALDAPEPMIRFDAAWSLTSVADERARAVLEAHVDDAECPYANDASIGEVVKQALEQLDEQDSNESG